MAITPIGTLGTGANSTSNSSWTFNTATNTLSAQDVGILIVSTDNIAMVDGPSSTHTSVSGLNGTWTKLGEYTNTVGGAAGDGVTISIWMFVAAGTVATGSTVTLKTSANTTDKTCTFHKFTKGVGKTLQLETESPSVGNATDASNGFGSVSFSGLSSNSRLYLRGLAKEANSTTQITPSTNFTAITNARSRNNANAVYVSGEFRINTSTGETSNPTLAVAGDTSALFIALEEVDYQPTVTTVLPTRVPASAITSTVLTIGLGILQTVLGQSATPPINQTDWPIFRTTAALSVETDSYPSDDQAGASLPVGESDYGRVQRPIYRPVSIEPSPILVLSAAPVESPLPGESTVDQPTRVRPATARDIGQGAPFWLLASADANQPAGQASIAPLIYGAHGQRGEFYQASPLLVQPVGGSAQELVRLPAAQAMRGPGEPRLPYIAGDPIGERHDELPRPRMLSAPKWDHIDHLTSIAGDPVGEQLSTLPPPVARRALQYEQTVTLPFIAGSPIGEQFLDLTAPPVRRALEYEQPLLLPYIAGDPVRPPAWDLPSAAARRMTSDATQVSVLLAEPVGQSAADIPGTRAKRDVGFAGATTQAIQPSDAPTSPVAWPLPMRGSLTAPEFAQQLLPFIAGDPVGKQHLAQPPSAWRRPVHLEHQDTLPFIAGDPLRPAPTDLIVRSRRGMDVDGMRGATPAAAVVSPVGASTLDQPQIARRVVRDTGVTSAPVLLAVPVSGNTTDLVRRRPPMARVEVSAQAVCLLAVATRPIAPSDWGVPPRQASSAHLATPAPVASGLLAIQAATFPIGANMQTVPTRTVARGRGWVDTQTAYLADSVTVPRVRDARVRSLQPGRTVEGLAEYRVRSLQPTRAVQSLAEYRVQSLSPMKSVQGVP